MRIRTILAAAAVPAALAASMVGATAASAAANPNSNPGNGAVVIRTQADANKLPYLVNQNVSVVAPASANVWLGYHEIQGNLNVTGHVTLAADIVDHDVNVGGPNGYLDFSNQASHIKGNLNVTGSAGEYIGGPSYASLTDHVQYPGADQTSAVVQVDGNLNFTGNTSSLWIGYPMHVNGSFTYAGNTVTAWWGDQLPFNPSWVSGLTADGGRYVS
jgi:hypothetical protein